MKNKILLGIGIVFLLATIVSAIDVGDVISQQQLDNIDLDTYDLNFSYLEFEKDRETNWQVGHFKFRSMGIKQELSEFPELAPTGNYVVIWHNFDFQYLRSEGEACVIEYGTLNSCVSNYIIPTMRKNRDNHILNYREELKQFQTVDFDLDDNDLGGL